MRSQTILLVLVALVLSSAGPALAQFEEGGSSEEVADRYYGDPVTQNTLLGSSPARRHASELTDEDAVSPSDLGAGIETTFGPGGTATTIPVHYSTGPWDFDLALPFYLSRQFSTFGGDAAATGLGDIFVSAAYSVASVEKLWLHPQLGIKLPTGDPKLVTDGVDTPLGTGSVDLLLGVEGWYRLDGQQGVSFDAAYRLNTSYENNAGWTTSYGDVLQFNAEYVRNVSGPFGALVGLTFFSMGESTIETAAGGEFTGFQGMTVLDLVPGVSYSVGAVDLRGLLMLPILTDMPDFSDASRGLSFRLGLHYGF